MRLGPAAVCRETDISGSLENRVVRRLTHGLLKRGLGSIEKTVVLARSHYFLLAPGLLLARKVDSSLAGA
ncbi:MAG: hypothetical protein V3T12_02405, partial [Acidiferrobacterales bacterium]